MQQKNERDQVVDPNHVCSDSVAMKTSTAVKRTERFDLRYVHTSGHRERSDRRLGVLFDLLVNYRETLRRKQCAVSIQCALTLELERGGEAIVQSCRR